MSASDAIAIEAGAMVAAAIMRTEIAVRRAPRIAVPPVIPAVCPEAARVWAGGRSY
jgi:hypothetical protein